MPSGNDIEVVNLTKRYDNILAVDNINFEVKKAKSSAS